MRTLSSAAVLFARQHAVPDASAARTARSGSSSCATGAPKTAITASPMNCSTVPLKRSTRAAGGRGTGEQRPRTSSGSGGRLGREAHEVGEEHRDDLALLRGTPSAPRPGASRTSAEAEAVRILLAAGWSRLARAERSRVTGERGRLPARGRYAGARAGKRAPLPLRLEPEVDARGAVAAGSGHEPLQSRDGDARDRDVCRAGSARIQEPGAPLAGRSIPYREAPFEWVRPRRFAVERTYGRGPFRVLRVLVDLTPAAGGGTELELPGLGHAAGPGRPAWRPSSSTGLPPALRGGLPPLRRRGAGPAWQGCPRVVQPRQSHASQARTGRARATLAALGGAREPGSTAASSIGWRRRSRPPTTSRAAPATVPLADTWQSRPSPNARALSPLHPSRAHGVALGAAVPALSRSGFIERHARRRSQRRHCSSCGIDFAAGFEESVELVFRPSPAIREVEQADYCVGGPRLTPHIVVQQLLDPGERRLVEVALGPARTAYGRPASTRSPAERRGQGAAEAEVRLAPTVPWRSTAGRSALRSTSPSRTEPRRLGSASSSARRGPTTPPRRLRSPRSRRSGTCSPRGAPARRGARGR